MALENTQPTNTNFLSPLGFQFHINRIPHVNYFCNSANLPGVTLAPVNRETPFVNTFQPGDKLDFEDFSLTFMVDENMDNYIELYDWIKGLGFPENFGQYREIAQVSENQLGKTNTVISDATLSILTSNHNVNRQIGFTNLFPTSIGELNFNSTDSDVVYIETTATFAYQKWSLL